MLRFYGRCAAFVVSGAALLFATVKRDQVNDGGHVPLGGFEGEDDASSGVQQHLVTLFGDVFAGRHDVYAVAFPKPGKPWAVSYAKTQEPLTGRVLLDHLEGRRRIGVYPLVDNYVRWFAVDFDCDKDALGRPIPGSFAKAWAEAEAQADAFEQAGLFVYLERSRSGEGVHLWGFFDEPVEARVVLRALKPLLVKAESYDRMYPVQAEVDDGGYGNLIALPFHGGSLADGNTAFLSRSTLEPVDPLAFLTSIDFNNRYVVEELAERAPKDTQISGVSRERPDGDFDPAFTGRPERPIRGFLKLISEYGCSFMHDFVKYPEKRTQQSWWVAVGQTTCFEHGRDAAHLLSALSPKYNAAETDELYDRISQETPHGCAYIHANFPEHSCKGCPLTAPYHLATKPILRLVGESTTSLARPDWRAAGKRARDRNTGVLDQGIPWGIPEIDAVTRLRRAELIVIGARPSVGKTSFMVDRALDLARRGVPVFVFSSETGEIGLTDRFVAAAAEIDSRRLRGEDITSLTDEEYAAIEAAMAELEQLPLFINYSATRADQILDLIEEAVLVNRIPLDQEYVIIQDYLQFGNPGDGGASEEYGRLTKVTAEFKYVAKILQRAFVAFSQLKRENEGDEKPDLDAFKGTGRIEETADVAMVLAGERISGSIAQRFLHGLKQREGLVGWTIRLLMYQAISRFKAVPTEVTAAPKDMFSDQPTAEV